MGSILNRIEINFDFLLILKRYFKKVIFSYVLLGFAVVNIYFMFVCFFLFLLHLRFNILIFSNVFHDLKKIYRTKYREKKIYFEITRHLDQWKEKTKDFFGRKVKVVRDVGMTRSCVCGEQFVVVVIVVVA